MVTESKALAFRRGSFTLERLADWAKRFRIKWRIRMHGEDWGAVDPGGFTVPLRDQLRKWARRARVFDHGPSSWAIPEERRESLLARHGGSKEV